MSKKVEEKIKKFIDDNLNTFSNLSNSEVIEYDLDEFNYGFVDYLKINYRFDYKGICVYFVDEKNEIWIENMEV
jgi:hypothetical protein